MSVNKSFNGVTYAIPNQPGESGWGTPLSNFLQSVADNAALKTTHKQNVRRALTSPITISASSDWCVDVRVGAITSAVTLPAGVEGQTFLICDGYGLFENYNCTVTPTSGTIQGAGSYIMNHNYQATLFQWSNDRWNIVAEHLGPFISPTKIGDGSVSFTEFLRLANITSAAVGISDTQTLTNKTISTASNTVGPLDSVTGTLSVSKGGTGLTAVGSALQVLRTNAGGTALEFASVGSGDVVGPGTSTDNAIVRFDGATGKLIQNSGATVDDSNQVSAASYTATGGTAANNTIYVASNSLRLRGGTSGLSFFNTSGTETFNMSDTGVAAIGPSTAQVATYTSYNGIKGVGSSYLGWAVLSGVSNTLIAADSAGSLQFYSDSKANITSGSFGGIKTGEVSAAGAWTLGPPSAIGTSTFAGSSIVGKTNGTAIAVGYVGQILESTYTSDTAFNATNTWGNNASVVLTPGVWLLFGALTAKLSTATGFTSYHVDVSSTNGGTDGSPNNYAEALPPTSSTNTQTTIAGVYANVTTNTTYYLNYRGVYSGGSPKHTGRLRAVRIA